MEAPAPGPSQSQVSDVVRDGFALREVGVAFDPQGGLQGLDPQVALGEGLAEIPQVCAPLDFLQRLTKIGHGFSTLGFQMLRARASQAAASTMSSTISPSSCSCSWLKFGTARLM